MVALFFFMAEVDEAIAKEMPRPRTATWAERRNCLWLKFAGKLTQRRVGKDEERYEA
jgi:hypothetical protein